MVATWQDYWFHEPGTRVLALLPRSWVDTVLPLTITPKPEKLARVFVARLELFTPSREQGLLSVVSDGPARPPGQQAALAVHDLGFGRFEQAALARLYQLQAMTRVASQAQSAKQTPEIH